jgi:hypothetical protein
LNIRMVMTIGWMAEQLGFDSQQREQIFQFSTGSGPALWPTVPSGYQDLFCRGQSDQLSEAFMHCQVQEMWSNTSTPTCCGDAVLN